MEYLFSVSGVQTYLWLPPLVSFIISFFTSMGGIAGAFLLLPFQMSFLDFTSPAVNSTNLVYNIVAIPGGVYRYLRERRIVWPLTLLVVLGNLPGMIIGCFIRLHWLPYPQTFKAFVGCVLLYVAMSLFLSLKKTDKNTKHGHSLSVQENFYDFTVQTTEFNWRRVAYRFQGQNYICSSSRIFCTVFIVGVVAGVYGVGGSAFIASALVAIWRLPIYTVAGTALISSFISSVTGIFTYKLLATMPTYAPMHIAPDWLLGASFGVGGMCGMYMGARTQRFVPAKWIKSGLGLLLFYVAALYLIDFVIYLKT